MSVASALLGTGAARPGVLLLGAGAVAAPSTAWPSPPAGWGLAGATIEQKIDALLVYIGPPRTDIVPGNWTLTELILALAGYTEP